MTIAPPLTEAAFMDQVTQYAELCGWETFHVRAGRTVDSWRTPGSGTMAKGFPDLLLVRGEELLFIEVKRDAGKTSPEQDRVLGLLDLATDTYVWRPRDWDYIEELLR